MTAMMGHCSLAVMLAAAACTLSGCVAVAAIPAVAGGVAAKKASDYANTTRTRRRVELDARSGATPLPPLPASTRSDAIVSKPVSPPAQLSVPSSAFTPVTRDTRPMRPGVVYTGALPRPNATSSNANVAPAASTRTNWTNIGHYVAAQTTTPVNSVLLRRGSSSDAPTWIPCANKSRAIVVRLETTMSKSGDRWTLDPSALRWLDVFQTLEFPVIFTATSPTEGRAAIEAAFRAANLSTLLQQGELRLGLTPAAMPGERASIAAKHCLVAIVGWDGNDFPNGLLPDNSPPALQQMWGAGWFHISADE